MIRNRPQMHRAMPHYEGLPPLPYNIKLEAIPELVKLSLFPLRHIEPMTTEILPFIEEYIENDPTVDELDFYRGQNSDFQLVFVVINTIFDCTIEGVSHLLPYSLSLLPASKRNQVQISKTDSVAAMRGLPLFAAGAAYLGLDPFSGEWSFFSRIDLITDLGAERAFTDELGIVYDYFFLRCGIDPATVLQAALGMPENRIKQYAKHRSKLLYSPFRTLDSRQVWGVENALELFVYQEFHRQSLPIPVPQALIFEDGSWQPGLYHAWEFFSDSEDSTLVSEVDFYFPEQKLAVFCDGATHSRKKIKERDRRIDAMLNSLGINSVRITSKEILRNIESAVARVRAAFA
jgi:Protein of unknown function (DUF559)